MNKSFPGASIRRFRIIALAEGVSYLLLLFIAMPLKYFSDFPQAVKYTGWIHGLLFVSYGFLLVDVWIRYKWTFYSVILAFVAALIPFGTFMLDKKLRREYFAGNHGRSL